MDREEDTHTHTSVSFLGDCRTLTESSPVRALRSPLFPSLCSPNQEQLCSSTVVSHSLSGNLKAIKQAPSLLPHPSPLAGMYVGVFLGYLRACVHMLEVKRSPRPCAVHLGQPLLRQPSWRIIMLGSEKTATAGCRACCAATLSS